MTCSNEPENKATVPIDAGQATLQTNHSEEHDTSTNTEPSGSHLFTFDSKIDIAPLTHLHAIDMTYANNPHKHTSSGGGLVSCFDRLSMKESSTCPQTSETPVGDVTESDFDGEVIKVKLTTETTATTTNTEGAKYLFLFIGDEDGDTMLHICILQEDDLKSFHIINRAPDFTYLNIQNNLLQTPLHLATLTNATKTVRKLVCAGADIQCQDRWGNSALHLACSRGHLEIVKQLLKPIMYEETLENKYPIPYVAIPQNTNVKNYDGLTCLHLAVLRQNVDILRFLMEADADPNIGDSKSGRTPLHMAAEQGFLDGVSLLISYRRTEIDARSYAEHTPALLAYSRGHVTIAKLLVRYGASYGFYHGCCQQGYASSSDSDGENDMDI